MMEVLYVSNLFISVVHLSRIFLRVVENFSIHILQLGLWVLLLIKWDLYFYINLLSYTYRHFSVHTVRLYSIHIEGNPYISPIGTIHQHGLRSYRVSPRSKHIQIIVIEFLAFSSNSFLVFV